VTLQRRAAVLAATLGVLATVGVATPASARDVAVPAPREAQAQQCTATTFLDQRVPALDVLQSELAWEVTRGAGVTVAVVDSGIAPNPHLTGAVVDGVDLVGDGSDPTGRADSYGHGTAIAGQIAARTIDGSGVQGLAPEASVMPVRVFAGVEEQQVEAGLGPSTPRLADGIRAAADRGAQIINVSMSTTVDEAVLRQAVAYATDRGSLIVASSGNRDSTLAIVEDDDDGVRYPAGVPGVLGVAATDLRGVVTDASIHGEHVAVSALGQDILTTSPAGADCIYAADAPATSFAAGYVSAAAALVAAAHPEETPAQWAYRLTATAIRADPDARTDSAGWGVVQPYEAIALIPGEGIRGPDGPFTDTGSTTEQTSAPVVVTAEPAPEASAIAIGLTASLGGLAVLGALGAAGVYLTRRREHAQGDRERSGRGLYGTVESDQTTG
jgi:membrane-anchored mycosin MYCP